MKKKILVEVDRRIKKINNYDYSQWKPGENVETFKIINRNRIADLKDLKEWISKQENLFIRVLRKLINKSK